MTFSRRSRSRKSGLQGFVSAVYWAGVVIVSVFLLWAVTMVFWQAFVH